MKLLLKQKWKLLQIKEKQRNKGYYMKLTNKLLITTLICGVVSLPTVLVNGNNNSRVLETRADELLTIADVLNTNSHFPTSFDTGWHESSNDDYRVFLDGQCITFSRPKTLLNLSFDISNPVSSDGNNYKSSIDVSSIMCYITFVFDGDTCVSISSSGGYQNVLSGTFSHVHNALFLVDKVEPTCETAGCQSYYECDCGNKYWEDNGESAGNEISDFEVWKNGEGYIMPDGHMYAGLPSTSWNGDQLTLSRHCMHCDYVDTRTVTGTYAKESDAAGIPTKQITDVATENSSIYFSELNNAISS